MASRDAVEEEVKSRHSSDEEKAPRKSRKRRRYERNDENDSDENDVATGAAEERHGGESALRLLAKMPRLTSYRKDARGRRGGIDLGRPDGEQFVEGLGALLSGMSAGRQKEEPAADDPEGPTATEEDVHVDVRSASPAQERERYVDGSTKDDTPSS